MKPKPITIKIAKEISTLGYDEVIIVGANYETGIQHVTTYGKSQAACENAAIGGNAVKKLLNWPEEMCNAKPARQLKREYVSKLESTLTLLVHAIEMPSDDDRMNLAKFMAIASIARDILTNKKTK